MENMSEDRGKNMAKKPSDHICIGLLAHVDAGKTTLAESILYHTGSIRKMGRVDHQDTFLDTDSMERARGITIFSKQAGFRLGESPSPFWIRRGMWISRRRWSALYRSWTMRFF